MLSPCIALQGDFLWMDLRSRCAPLHFPPTSPVGPVQHRKARGGSGIHSPGFRHCVPTSLPAWMDLRSRCAPLHFPPTSPVGPVQHWKARS